MSFFIYPHHTIFAFLFSFAKKKIKYKNYRQLKPNPLNLADDEKMAFSSPSLRLLPQYPFAVITPKRHRFSVAKPSLFSFHHESSSSFTVRTPASSLVVGAVSGKSSSGTKSKSKTKAKPPPPSLVTTVGEDEIKEEDIVEIGTQESETVNIAEDVTQVSSLKDSNLWPKTHFSYKRLVLF